MRTGDIAAAAADLDPGSAAAAFRSQQVSALQALHQLPLQVWSYSVAAPVTAPAAVAAAAHRYGAPATIVHLDLRYQLRGVDAVPVPRELWWTFVSRDGHTRLAGDDDLAADGGVSWHGPWDFGPVAVRRTPAAARHRRARRRGPARRSRRARRYGGRDRDPGLGHRLDAAAHRSSFPSTTPRPRPSARPGARAPMSPRRPRAERATRRRAG